MLFDGDLLTNIIRVAFAGLVALLGLVVLIRGWRLPWLFSGAAALLFSILLIRMLGLTFGFATEGWFWEIILPAGAAVVGALMATYNRMIAYVLIGLLVGGALAIWVARTILPVVSGFDLWSVLGLIVMMLLGALFVVRFGDVAVILFSVAVGVCLILNALNLPSDAELVAAGAIAAAIAGLVIQYHDYLVEQRAAHNRENLVADEMSPPPRIPTSAATPPAATP